MDPIIGLKKAYYAIVASDVEGAISYNTPVAFKEIQQIGVSPKVNKVQIPADDDVEEISECVSADVTVQKVYLTSEEDAVLHGRTVDSSGGVYGGDTDNPPYVAFGYMRTIHGGKVLCVWLLKTKFAPSNSTADTKDPGGIKPQYSSVSASAIKRKADGQWIYSRQFDSEAAADAANFFTLTTLQALAGSAAPTAIALSSSTPADDATGVSKTAALSLTFNNKIMSEAVSVIGVDAAEVTITKVWDSAGKVLTITHTAFAGTTSFIINVNGVTDIYGQTLAATTVIFTTAA